MDRGKDFEILLGVTGAVRRISKIRFGVDGSIYVFFPGFISSKGILCNATLKSGSTTVDLADGGAITSHLVKYAHHPDGEAHFSQDGKIKTEIRKKAVPLAQQRGHLFSIQAQNFGSFPRLEGNKKRTLTFNLAPDIEAIKIAAWRFPLSDIQFPDEILPGAAPILQTPHGNHIGLFFLPPENFPFSDVMLFLAIETTPALSQDNSAHLIFTGAFDPPEFALDHDKDTQFIAFAYPCADYETLSKKLESVDLASPSKPACEMQAAF